MRKVQNIRDLLVGPAHPLEANTLQMVAYEDPEHSVEPDPLFGFTARLPGDEVADHPLRGEPNPLEGENVLFLARALNEGTLDPAHEKFARILIDRYQKMTGETVYASRNHIPDHPVEQQYADEDTISPANGLRRADPYK